MKQRIDIDSRYPPKIRKAIAEEIKNKILERTARGRGVYDKKLRNFPKYEEEYAKKKGNSTVNLRLTSEMLDNLKILSHASGTILMGFDNGTPANGKAEGNIKGTYGQKRPSPKGKERPFLDLSDGEYNAIMLKYPISEVTGKPTPTAMKNANTILGDEE